MENSYRVLQNRFSELFKIQGKLFRSPGRINLIGEHTDYNDGLVMPAAIDKEILFAIENSTDNVTVIHAEDFGESFTVDLGNVKSVNSPLWANYLLGVIHKLQQDGYVIKPFKCVFGGNIPVGAGLSSSAALECGFVFALNSLNNLGIAPNEMIRIAQWSEHHYAGVLCGIMDQFSSMMGKEGHVFVLDCRSLKHTYYPLHLNGYRILLLDTNVKHSLASSEYNTRRAECEEGVRVLRRFYPTITNLRDLTSTVIKKHEKDLDEKVYNRCLYVAEEIERVQRASEDLAAGNIQAFGKRMYETHEGLKNLYEVSCPELDFLVTMTNDNPDVLGARMMGGGFGGCTINIVNASAVNRLVQTVNENYSNKFGIDLNIYEVRITDGVSMIK